MSATLNGSYHSRTGGNSSFLLRIEPSLGRRNQSLVSKVFLHKASRRVVFYSEQSTRLSSPTSRQKVAFGVTSISVQTGPRTRFPASTGQSESSTQWSRGPSRQIELRVIPSDDEGRWRGIE